jgi:DNA-binding transcriptional regulator GbsR (MarR family)
MATEKKTKVMYFTEIRELIENTDVEGKADFLEFIDKEVETLKKRAAAASERAAKKRAESDELTDQIYNLIGSEPMTVDEIVENLGVEGVTRNKVTARLGKLVKAEKIVKEAVKVDGNKRMTYARA